MKKFLLGVIALTFVVCKSVYAGPVVEVGSFGSSYRFASDYKMNPSVVFPVELGVRLSEFPVQLRVRAAQIEDRELALPNTAVSTVYSSALYASFVEVNVMHQWETPILDSEWEGEHVILSCAAGLGALRISESDINKSRQDNSRDGNLGGRLVTASYATSRPASRYFLTVPMEVGVSYRLNEWLLGVGVWGTVSGYQNAYGAAVRAGITF